MSEKELDASSSTESILVSICISIDELYRVVGSDPFSCKRLLLDAQILLERIE